VLGRRSVSERLGYYLRATATTEEQQMAQRVERFPDLPSTSRYPWNEWLDGSVWELVAGQDFKGKTSGFRSVAITHAKKRNGMVRTRVLRARDAGEPDRLYLQFTPNGHKGRSREAASS
jgi:hypothetical protein